MINGLIALVCVLGAVFCFWTLQNTKDANTMYLVGGIVFAVLAAVFGVLFMSGRVNKNEDIHITE